VLAVIVDLQKLEVPRVYVKAGRTRLSTLVVPSSGSFALVAPLVDGAGVGQVE
jgi:hypothetical protein